MRRLLALVAVAVLAGGAGVAAAGVTGEWAWQEGDAKAYVGEPAGSSDLVAAAQGDIDFDAGHVRLISQQGDFQFVHDGSGPATLNAYVLGTPTRTPLQIGAPADVTALIVAGSKGQTADLQQWQVGGKTVAAITGSGLLRLGGVTLDPVVANGVVELYGISGGKRQLLATGVPAK